MDIIDLLATAVKILFSLLIGGLLLLCAPFAILRMAEHWNDPEPLHSGFTPECPTWQDPNH